MGKGKRPSKRQAEETLTPEELARERWLPIEGWAGYEVSDMGRVRSWKRQTSEGFGKVAYIVDYRHRPRALAGWLNVDGYRRFILTEKPDRVKHVFGHVLVLETFVGPCPSGMQSAHGDGCRSNNRLSNLRWATPKENTHDKKAHGTFPSGERGPKAKLTWAQVQRIREAYLAGVGPTELARRFRVTNGAVSGVVRGRNWQDGYEPPQPRPQRKLTGDDVKAIKTALTAGAKGKDLAERYGVTVMVISNIKLGKSYRET